MTMQGVPSVFPNGISNAQPDSFGVKCPMPLWPGSFYTWFSDFDSFDRALTATGLTDWSVAGTNAAIANSSVTDAFGGIVSIATAAADNDQFIAQWGGSNTGTNVAETFSFVAGKECFFACRFQLADVVESDFIIGLAVAGATPISVADGVFFQKPDGSAVLSLVSNIATPLSASDAVATLVNATWVEAAYHYNGVDAINAYINGAFAGSVGITALPTTELAVTFGIQSGEAVAKSALVDWIYAARER